MSMDSSDWDPEKDLANQAKHGISFSEAQYAFADSNRVIAEDPTIVRRKNGISALE
jgi:hypothetical protein